MFKLILLISVFTVQAKAFSLFEYNQDLGTCVQAKISRVVDLSNRGCTEIKSEQFTVVLDCKSVKLEYPVTAFGFTEDKCFQVAKEFQLVKD